MSLKALVAWAVASGAYVEPVEIVTAADGNRSVFAQRAIARGEVVVSVPRALMIDDSDVAHTPIGRAVKQLGPMLASRYMPLATWLAVERRTPDSTWSPFLQALPASFSVPPPDVIRALRGTRAGEVLEESAQLFDDDLAVLTDMLDDASAISPSELDWGLRIARSRCFQLAPTGDFALVPVADMFDHAQDPDADWIYRFDTARFEIRAARPLHAGDEIRIRYGSRDNAQWLAAKGFVVENNPEDEVTLRFAAKGRAYHVRTRFDFVFQRAMEAARELAGDDDPRGALAVVRDAAQHASSLIADVDVESRWARTCEIVRTGERAVLAEIVAFADRAAELVTRSAEERRAYAQSLAADATGADRLLRAYLLATS